MASKQEMLDMAARLRATVSESKRRMLDEAAMMLEEKAETAKIEKGLSFIKCRECGFAYHRYDYDGDEQNFNFCPYCGKEIE